MEQMGVSHAGIIIGLKKKRKELTEKPANRRDK